MSLIIGDQIRLLEFYRIEIIPKLLESEWERNTERKYTDLRDFWCHKYVFSISKKYTRRCKQVHRVSILGSRRSERGEKKS